MRIYTSRINYNGADRIDITVKSGVQAFAPSWSMVMAYKSGKMNPDEYQALYLARMRQSYVENRAVWDKYLKRERLVFCCYCLAGNFCHRILLAEIFVKLGGEYCGEIK